VQASVRTPPAGSSPHEACCPRYTEVGFPPDLLDAPVFTRTPVFHMSTTSPNADYAHTSAWLRLSRCGKTTALTPDLLDIAARTKPEFRADDSIIVETHKAQESPKEL